MRDGARAPHRSHRASRSRCVVIPEDCHDEHAPSKPRRNSDRVLLAKWEHGANHLVFIYPLWLGTLPALLKGFLEQVFRDGFAVRFAAAGRGWTRLLKGKSARIVVTMGMPALIYRVYFGAHGLKSLERSVLAFAGIGPIRESLIGRVESRGTESRGRRLIKMQTLGRAAR